MSGLSLSRRPGESIWIGDDVRLTVKTIEPGRVLIQIVAPPEVVVDREELRERKRSGARHEG